MKVIQVGSDSIHFSSFCTSIQNLINEFDVICETEFKVDGMKQAIIAPFRSLNPIKLAGSYRKIKKALQDKKPDAIHIHQVNRLAFVVCHIARKLKIPVVTTAWGSDVLLMPKKNFIFKAITRSALRNSHAVTANSQNLIQAMQRIAPAENKYFKIQYGIDPIKPGLKENIIYSNRLLKELYRIDLIIKLFAEFYTGHPNWKLVVAANGPLEDSLKALATELLPPSAFEFVGWVDSEKNAAYYSKSKIYASLPISDGTSSSLLECMSADCIPVVGNLPVSHEWIESGINGIIYSENTNPFEQALLIDNDACFERNRELIRNEALRSSTRHKFYNLYKKVLN